MPSKSNINTRQTLSTHAETSAFLASLQNQRLKRLKPKTQLCHSYSIFEQQWILPNEGCGSSAPNFFFQLYYSYIYFRRGDDLRTFAGKTSDRSKTKYRLPFRRNAAVRCSRMCGFPCRPSVPRITPKDFAPLARSIASLPGAELQKPYQNKPSVSFVNILGRAFFVAVHF